MSKPWTEAHQQEAFRRSYEIAAELADVTDRKNGGPWVASHAFGNLFDEASWRRLLLTGGLSVDRIDRELRRVRGLAEGRLVRETVWACRTAAMGGNHNEAVTDERRAREWLSTRGMGDRVVRIARIRRTR